VRICGLLITFREPGIIFFGRYIDALLGYMSRHRSSVLRGFILAIGLFWQFGGSVAFKSEDFKVCVCDIDVEFRFGWLGEF
jgi:hypothetical protein